MNCVPEYVAATLVLAGAAGASRTAPPTNTRILARLKRVLGHVRMKRNLESTFLGKHHYVNVHRECAPDQSAAPFDHCAHESQSKLRYI